MVENEQAELTNWTDREGYKSLPDAVTTEQTTQLLSSEITDEHRVVELRNSPCVSGDEPVAVRHADDEVRSLQKTFDAFTSMNRGW